MVEVDSDIKKYISSLSYYERLEWACKTFESICVTTSLQTQSVPLLHLISKINKKLSKRIHLFFIDTGYHFPETLQFKDKIEKLFNLQIRSLQSDTQFRSNDSKHLYIENPDLCCKVNKVLPLENLLNKYDLWISGIRSEQTKFRESEPIIKKTTRNILKFHPLIDWDNKSFWTYHNTHDLPMHPLSLEGYTSIGCKPCTSQNLNSEDSRSGRWQNCSKTECGLHTDIK